MDATVRFDEVLRRRGLGALRLGSLINRKSSPILQPLSRSGQHPSNFTYLRSRASVTAPGKRVARRAASPR
jgi:hypothetical protein